MIPFPVEAVLLMLASAEFWRSTHTINSTVLDSTSLPVMFQCHVTSTLSSETGRPDYYNYRKLLWNCLEKIPEVAETKGSMLATQFFKFLE